jgi:hypothetical protein
LKLQADAMRINIDYRPYVAGLQQPKGIWRALNKRHKGIQNVALRGTRFEGRGSASGVRHRRLVDAAWRLILGRIAGFDGLSGRLHSSSVKGVIRTASETMMALQNPATGTSILAELAFVGASGREMGQRLFAAITRRVQDVFDPYRPELHYMRGPGPKSLEKHGITAGSRRCRRIGAG